MQASGTAAHRRGLLAQRLLVLCLTGWVLFDFPFLRLALGDGASGAAPATLLGLPRLPLWLFAAWALLIVLLAWLMERGGEADEPAADAPPGATDKGG